MGDLLRRSFQDDLDGFLGYDFPGLGDFDLDGMKVGFLSLIPYLGISMFIWTWQSMSYRGFIALMALMGWMAIVGVATYCYLLYLNATRHNVHPNNTAVYFSLVSLVFMGLIAGLYRFGKINSAPYLY
ncbi:MAG: hypothetical protein U0176_14685 [Bacteroidia bacterium]